MTEKQKNILNSAFLNGEDNKIREYIESYFSLTFAKVKQIEDEQVLLELLFHPFLTSSEPEQILAKKNDDLNFSFSVEVGDIVLVGQTKTSPDLQKKEQKDYEQKPSLSFAVILFKVFASEQIEGMLLREKNSSINLKENEINIKTQKVSIGNENAEVISLLQDIKKLLSDISTATFPTPPGGTSSITASPTGAAITTEIIALENKINILKI